MKPAAKSIDWSCVLGPLAAPRHGLGSDELSQLEQATQQHPRRAIRLTHPRWFNQLPFDVEAVPWFPGAPATDGQAAAPRGLFVAEPDIRPGAFVHYAAGDYYIQDAGSMLALALCEIVPGQTVCDTCAAPGGKSTGGLDLLAGSGLLVANEVIASRLPVLGLALSRSGFGNHLMTNLEVQDLSQLTGDCFDCVIVDAPCTGQSMIVRGKQSMAAYSTAQIEHSSARQQRIIRAAADLVKPGGRLVYSTCTFSFAENEGIVADFLQQRPTWQLKRFPNLSAWETPGYEGCYRLWPHRDRCAGAFAAALIRAADDSQAPALAGRLPRARHAWSPVAGLPEQIDWLEQERQAEQAVGAQWFRRGQHLHRFSGDFPQAWISLAASGTPIAEERSGRMEPLYGSALLVGGELRPRLETELSDAEAIGYGAGDALRRGEAPQGWSAVTWRGRRLSWGKLAGGVLKNHFPKPLRQTLLRVE